MSDAVLTTERVALFSSPRASRSFASRYVPIVRDRQDIFVGTDEDEAVCVEETTSDIVPLVGKNHIVLNATATSKVPASNIRFFIGSFGLFMVVLTAFLLLMVVYYATGVALIHPFLILVGVFGTLGLVVTSVIDILERYA